MDIRNESLVFKELRKEIKVSDEELADRIVWIVVVVGIILAICAAVASRLVEANGVENVTAIWTGIREVTISWHQHQDNETWSYVLRKQNNAGGWASVGRTLCGDGWCRVVDEWSPPELAIYRIVWDFGGPNNAIFGDYPAKYVVYTPIIGKRCLKNCGEPKWSMEVLGGRND